MANIISHLGLEKMSFGEFSCVVHLPKLVAQTRDKSGAEIVHGLPEYAPIEVYRVEDFNALCPAHWTRSSATATDKFPPFNSFFCGVEERHGLWLDLNGLFGLKYQFAVRLSVQGACGFTALPMTDLKLEQYKPGGLCPRHKIPFIGERLCTKCKYVWPHQNYISTACTPRGLLWIDGWRSKGGRGGKPGQVRQFFFTRNQKLGVAKQVLGKARTFSIGLLVYPSVVPKPVEAKPWVYGLEDFSQFGPTIGMGTSELSSRPVLEKKLRPRKVMYRDGARSLERGESMRGGRGRLAEPPPEIGAGALIAQNMYPDPNPLEFYHWERPIGAVVLNYDWEHVIQGILAQAAEGLGESATGDDSFLRTLQVGIGDQGEA